MVNYAVLGCGGIGNVHCAAINADPKSNLLIVCDIVEDRARKLADSYHCRFTLDFQEILDDSTIDAVTICLPHNDHCWSFQKALSFGKNVICEKPLAITPGDIRQLVSASEDSSLNTTIAFQHRYSPLVKALKKYLDQGSFGEIVRGEIDFKCERTREYYDADDWRGKWNTEGGGTLINQALHTIDLANLFLGTPLSVRGRVENRMHDFIEVEDYAEGMILYNSGVELELRVENSSMEKWKPLLKVEGTMGGFLLEGSDSIKLLGVISEDVCDDLLALEEGMKGGADHPGKEDYGNMHTMLFSDFSSAVVDKRKPFLSLRESSLANQIVLGFYQSQFSGEVVTLPVSDYHQPKLRV